MTVKEILDRLSERIPAELSEPWDNDGAMCVPDSSAEVHRALVALDVTDEIIDYAIEGNFDLIVSHHPLIFKPVRAFTDDDPTAMKLMRLFESGIAVLSFHTRADRVEGGVNDQLCDLIGLFDTVPFGDGLLGRIGSLDEEMSLDDFAYRLKDALGLQDVLVADGYNKVARIAVVGGEGKEYIDAAVAAGADTFISGRIGYNTMEEAPERGINLIEAGHFYTENPVTSFFANLLTRLDPHMYVEIRSSNIIRIL